MALGSDSANSSNYLDAVRTMDAVALGFKDGRCDARVVPTEQELIGSIEVDKKADLVVSTRVGRSGGQSWTRSTTRFAVPMGGASERTWPTGEWWWTKAE